jgi:hypothetical protein
MAQGTGNRWLIWILFGVMILLSLALVGTGGTVWADAVQTWSAHDHLFSGWQMLDWIIGLLGAAMVGAGLLVAGFVLRFMRWEKAPLASLVLSIVAVAFNLSTYAIFSQTQDSLLSLDLLLLHVGCVVGLFIVVLPPFLHWLRAKPGARAIVTAPAPAETSIQKAS